MSLPINLNSIKEALETKGKRPTDAEILFSLFNPDTLTKLNLSASDLVGKMDLESQITLAINLSEYKRMMQSETDKMIKRTYNPDAAIYLKNEFKHVGKPICDQIGEAIAKSNNTKAIIALIEHLEIFSEETAISIINSINKRGTPAVVAKLDETFNYFITFDKYKKTSDAWNYRLGANSLYLRRKTSNYSNKVAEIIKGLLNPPAP